MRVHVHEPTGSDAPVNVGPGRLDKGDELLFIVERGHDDVPTLPALRVELLLR